MPSINKLTASDTISAGDLFAVFIQNNGDARKVAMSVLMDFINENLTVGGFGSYVTQYSAPSATGFSVTITDGADDNTNVHLILAPTGGFAAGTIVLPLASKLVDKQEILVNCTQAVTTLTVDGNGATAVTGEPATLTANDFFRLKYDAPTKTWYRVG